VTVFEDLGLIFDAHMKFEDLATVGGTVLSFSLIRHFSTAALNKIA